MLFSKILVFRLGTAQRGVAYCTIFALLFWPTLPVVGGDLDDGCEVSPVPVAGCAATLSARPRAGRRLLQTLSRVDASHVGVEGGLPRAAALTGVGASRGLPMAGGSVAEPPMRSHAAARSVHLQAGKAEPQGDPSFTGDVDNLTSEASSPRDRVSNASSAKPSSGNSSSPARSGRNASVMHVSKGDAADEALRAVHSHRADTAQGQGIVDNASGNASRATPAVAVLETTWGQLIAVASRAASANTELHAIIILFAMISCCLFLAAFSLRGMYTNYEMGEDFASYRQTPATRLLQGGAAAFTSNMPLPVGQGHAAPYAGDMRSGPRSNSSVACGTPAGPPSLDMFGGRGAGPVSGHFSKSAMPRRQGPGSVASSYMAPSVMNGNAIVPRSIQVLPPKAQSVDEESGSMSGLSRHLSPGLVVPPGNECLLVVPPLAVVGIPQREYAAFDVKDLHGKAVISCEVFRPDWSGGTRGPIAVLRAARAEGDVAGPPMQMLAYCTAGRESGGRRSTYVYDARDELFAHVMKDPFRPIYLLSSARTGIQITFEGNWSAQGGPSVRITGRDGNEALAETEPVEESPGLYRMRVISNVDVGVVLCGLLSIDHMNQVSKF